MIINRDFIVGKKTNGSSFTVLLELAEYSLYDFNKSIGDCEKRA